MVQHPAEARDISLLGSVKTDFGMYPVSYSAHSRREALSPGLQKLGMESLPLISI